MALQLTVHRYLVTYLNPSLERFFLILTVKKQFGNFFRSYNKHWVTTCIFYFVCFTLFVILMEYYNHASAATPIAKLQRVRNDGILFR